MSTQVPPNVGDRFPDSAESDERLRLVARLLEGEKMALLRAEFGISRQTGYKIYDRYTDCGIDALTDRRWRPYRQANRLPSPVAAVIVRLKREYPGWGAPRIREKRRQHTTAPNVPAISTLHAVLDRHGLVQRRRGPSAFVRLASGRVRRQRQDRSGVPACSSRTVTTRNMRNTVLASIAEKLGQDDLHCQQSG